MDDLKRMAIFATVVQRGSMTAAAKVLGMSASAVSQHIRQLERDSGVTLLHRSTRQITLTDAGQRLYVQCAALTAAAARARAELAAQHDTPTGELRLSAPVGFAQHAAPALGAWLARFADLRLHLLLDDVPIDLIQARVDIALRYGAQTDSKWVARKLGSTPFWLCAAPQWVQAHGGQLPQHPQHLAHATWLALAHNDTPPAPPQWQHRSSGETFAPLIQPQSTSNHQAAVQALCEAGLGIALLAAIDVRKAVQAGRLLQLLPQWDMGQLDIWALTPQRDAQPAKVRQVMQELQAYLHMQQA